MTFHPINEIYDTRSEIDASPINEIYGAPNQRENYAGRGKHQERKDKKKEKKEEEKKHSIADEATKSTKKDTKIEKEFNKSTTISTLFRIQKEKGLDPRKMSIEIRVSARVTTGIIKGRPRQEK